MKLSAIVITQNSSATLSRTLQSLQFADEIIVVDANSTDNSRDIAARHKARVIVNNWPGYGRQKNIGLAQAQGEWALFIDADEEVPPALAQEISQSLQEPVVDFFWLRVITVFLHRPLNHLMGHNPRLFRRRAGRWTNDPVHEQVETISGERLRLGDARSHVLTTPLLHYSHSTVSGYLKRMHHYTTLDAAQMHRTNRHRSGRPVTPLLLLPWHLAARQFIKLYFYRRGFLDSYAGLAWSVLSAYYEWEMGKKYNKLCA